MQQLALLYNERFLESYAGAIITDPATAIMDWSRTAGTPMQPKF
jgi:hypothetical protein